ncbi:MAG: SixA phosphatase family protein [Candidatus Rokuibacteriota bacterium]
MRLLIIRHAAAVPSGTPGIAADDRPLTPKGKARFRAAAKGLARITPRPDVLLTSPLPRARQTAEIAARAWKRLAPRLEPALASGRLEAIVAALAKESRDATVAIVGHEPVLAGLLARLVGAPRGEPFAFKKGGAALVDLPDGPMAGGRLIWFVKPRILRDLSAG